MVVLNEKCSVLPSPTALLNTTYKVCIFIIGHTHIQIPQAFAYEHSRHDYRSRSNTYTPTRTFDTHQHTQLHTDILLGAQPLSNLYSSINSDRNYIHTLYIHIYILVEVNEICSFIACVMLYIQQTIFREIDGMCKPQNSTVTPAHTHQHTHSHTQSLLSKRRCHQIKCIVKRTCKHTHQTTLLIHPQYFEQPDSLSSLFVVSGCSATITDRCRKLLFQMKYSEQDTHTHSQTKQYKHTLTIIYNRYIYNNYRKCPLN